MSIRQERIWTVVFNTAQLGVLLQHAEEYVIHWWAAPRNSALTTWPAIPSQLTSRGLDRTTMLCSVGLMQVLPEKVKFGSDQLFNCWNSESPENASTPNCESHQQNIHWLVLWKICWNMFPYIGNNHPNSSEGFTNQFKSAYLRLTIG